MRQFGIFAKYWRPGSVKTRLAATVGEKLAAEFHRVSLQTLLAQLGNVADRHVLAIWPPEDAHRFDPLVPPSWHLDEQVPGDLGQKMAAYFKNALIAGADRVVLIGSDSPTITTSVIADAFTALANHDVVLGPCDDGGYYLVGCRDSRVPIWDGIAWGTADVWSQTVAALQQANCAWYALPKGFDVDEVNDVRRLSEMLHADAYADPLWDALRDTCRMCLEQVA